MENKILLLAAYWEYDLYIEDNGEKVFIFAIDDPHELWSDCKDDIDCLDTANDLVIAMLDNLAENGKMREYNVLLHNRIDVRKLLFESIKQVALEVA